MKIVMLKPFKRGKLTGKAGDVVDFPAHVANSLIKGKVAKPKKAEPKK
jgi:hypothetical protein